jgi:hypothetical protein
VLRLSTEQTKEGDLHAEKCGKQGNVGRGRATVFLVGLAVILALVFGLASTTLAGMGVGAPFNLGQTNTVDRASTLVNNGVGPALNLRVGPVTATPANNPEAPMRVNSQKVVTHLNADKLDGMHASQLAPRGYARVSPTTPFPIAGSSKGVVGIRRTSPGNVYCFDLTFDPKAAIASGHINNNATVGTVVGNDVPDECPDTHEEAAAITYAANDTTSAHRDDLPFGIAFM